MECVYVRVWVCTHDMVCLHPPKHPCIHKYIHMQDLLRCQGVWYHSIRYGFLFGLQRATLEYEMVGVFMSSKIGK